MDDRLVVLEADGPVAWVRLNRPEAMNSLNQALLGELNDALDAIEDDEHFRVVVLTGTATVFCGGADLKGLPGPDGSIDPGQLLAFVRQVGSTLDRIAALGMPVIAAVNGYALAGGLELVLACDLVVAARSARLGDAHANYGLLPGAGGASRLVRVVGPNVAKYLAFSGRFMAAADLVPYGLVNEVVRDDQLVDHVNQLASHLAAKSRVGLAQMKRLINDGLEQSLSVALRSEQQALAAHANSPDAREGLAAFREKRQPHYLGNSHV